MFRLCARVCIAGLASLFAALAVLTAAAAWRLTTAPLELAFLTPYLEVALAEGAGGDLAFDIDGTAIVWDGFAQPLLVRATDVTIREPGGRGIAAIPALALGLDTRRLITGEVRPTDLFIDRPRVTVFLADEGPLMAWETAQQSVPAAGGTATAYDVATLLQDLHATDNLVAGPLSTLVHVGVRGAEVRVIGEAEEDRWHLPLVDADLYRRPDGIGFETQFRLAQLDRTADVVAAAELDAASGRIEAQLAVDGLQPAILAPIDPILDPLRRVESLVTGTGVLSFSPALTIESGRYALSSGVGRIDLPELYVRPLTFAGLSLQGGFDAASRHVRVDRFDIDLGGPRIQGDARLTQVDTTTDATLSVSLADLPVDLLSRYWPDGINDPARAWIVANISQGIVQRADLDLLLNVDGGNWDAPEVGAVSAGLVYDGLQVRYLEGMPPVTDVSGTGAFDGTDFTLDVTGGRLGDIAVREGAIRINRFDDPPEWIDIAITISGPLRTALNVIDSPRLRYAEAVGLDPSVVSGEMAGRLEFNFPLLDLLPLDEVAIATIANLRDVDLGAVVGGMAARDIDAQLSLDGRGMRVEGTGQVQGHSIRFTWDEAFANGSRTPTRVAASGILTEALAAELGLPDTIDFAGQAPIDAVYRRTAQGAELVALTADLGPAGLAVPALGWGKPEGEAAAASATLLLGRNGIEEVRDASFTAPDVAIAGAGELSPDPPGFTELTVTEFRSGHHDISMHMTPTGANGYAVSVNGASLDLPPLIRRAASISRGGTGDAVVVPDSLQLVADVHRLRLSDSRHLTNAHAVAELRSGSVARASLTAGFPDGGALSIGYDPSHPQFDFGLAVSDVGAALQSLAGTAAVRGGHLELVATESDGWPGVFDGWVRSERLTIADAPAIARFFAAQDFASDEAPPYPESLLFDEITAEFSFDGTTATFRDGRAVGGQLGLTLSGVLGPNGFDFEGVFVPLYGINRAIGSIPLLGDLLTGGDGQGIFALTYTVTGPITAPNVNTYALSALTPGLLRSLFFGTGEGSGPLNGEAVSDWPDTDR